MSEIPNREKNECGVQVKNLPLPVNFDADSCRLFFGPGVVCKETSGKSSAQMRGVLRVHDYNREEPFYRFYAGVCLQEDEAQLKKHHLRYDLIVVYAGTAGGEYKKTSGHYHSISAAANGMPVSYPEIYEVLQGHAVFVLQSCGTDGEITDVAAVQAAPGDKLIIPPGYGHATVNVGREPLVFADLVSDLCKNTYGQIAQNHGMCCYVLKEEGGFALAPNPNYAQAPQARVCCVQEYPRLGTARSIPLYQTAARHPEWFDYLNHPEKYMDVFMRLS